MQTDPLTQPSSFLPFLSQVKLNSMAGYIHPDNISFSGRHILTHLWSVAIKLQWRRYVCGVLESQKKAKRHGLHSLMPVVKWFLSQWSRHLMKCVGRADSS